MPLARPPIKAVLWDLGGVILESPFDAFDRYERDKGLPAGFLRSVNNTNPDDNAWARLERGEISVAEFCERFEQEAARLGHPVDSHEVVGLLAGAVRPQMAEAARRCASKLEVGVLTNNFVGFDGAAPSWGRGELQELLSLVDVVIESSKVGLRKPDPEIYRLACRELDVEPNETVFLDDLGINLKPARAMGMHTIKVTEPAAAIARLEELVGFPLH